MKESIEFALIMIGEAVSILITAFVGVLLAAWAVNAMYGDKKREY